MKAGMQNKTVNKSDTATQIQFWIVPVSVTNYSEAEYPP